MRRQVTEIDDIELEEQDLLLEEQAEGQELYEHFRMEVDNGQEPLRIDKYLA